jgi:uncharacterized protein involved in exopolysaccharide biosynthesis/Mrp family chromosome partitioning ATPase
MILVVTIVGATLAVAIGLLIPPKYTATAAITVDLQQLVTGERALPPTDESPIDTQVAMLTSRDHLDRVLDSLWQDPAFGSTEHSQRNETRANGTGRAGEAPPQPDITEHSTDTTETDVGSLSFRELSRRLKLWMGALDWSGRGTALNAEQLARNLNVMQERRSRIVTIRFTSKSPQQAAIIVNRIAQLYVDSQIRQKQASLTQELARIDDRIAELKKQVESAQMSARTLVDRQPGRGQAANREGGEPDARLGEFARAAALATQLQINLLRRQEDIRGQLESITPDVSIRSLASPPKRPSSPHPILFILPALIVCVIGAGFLAVVLDRLDRGLRGERDINDALGIPCIGLVPQLGRKHKNRPCEYLAANPFSAYAHVVRSVAVALQLTTPQRASRVFLITSSVPMEGRSTLALSLAACVARLGRRVVVVDFDVRQGSMPGEPCAAVKRQILDPETEDPPIAQSIKHIPNLGIDYLAMPCCQGDPLAPFARQQMPHLLRQLQEGHDCVIIDGPPVLGIAESSLLAPLADKLLFVVKWGSTRREVAQNALHRLRDAGCFDNEWSEPPAAVVTQVELEQHARHRFGDVGELLVKYRDYYSQPMSRDSDGRQELHGHN